MTNLFGFRRDCSRATSFLPSRVVGPPFRLTILYKGLPFPPSFSR